jgi:hypothetical protein
MTLFQELGLAEVAFGDLSAFVAGSPVTASPTIAGKKLNVSAVHLGATPDPSYQVFQGSVMGMIEFALMDAAAFSEGATLKIAEKIGNTWYGETISPAS